MGYLAAITAAVQAAGFAASGIKYLIDNSDDIVKNLNSLATMLDAAKGLMDTAVDVVPINELINQAETGETAQLEEPTQRDADPSDKQLVKVPGFIKRAKERESSTSQTSRSRGWSAGSSSRRC